MGNSAEKPTNTSKSQDSINPDILKTGLECPVCFNMLKPPTHACESGHTICEDCFRKLPQGGNECPECRKPLVMRNIALERLLETIPHSCENKEAGCEEELVAEQLTKHQEECQWRKVPCFFPSCIHLQPLLTYNNHVQQHHAEHLLDISANGNVSFTITPTEDKHYTGFFLRSEESHFIQPYHINLSLDFNTNELHACLCSWQQEEPYDFNISYNFNITTRDGTLLNVSLRTVPVSHGNHADVWKTHENCFFTKPMGIGLRKCKPVDVSVTLKLKTAEQTSAIERSVNISNSSKKEFDAFGYNIEITLDRQSGQMAGGFQLTKKEA